MNKSLGDWKQSPNTFKEVKTMFWVIYYSFCISFGLTLGIYLEREKERHSIPAMIKMMKEDK